MAFDAAQNVKVTRVLSDENREVEEIVMASSFKDAIAQVDDGRECSQVLMEKLKD